MWNRERVYTASENNNNVAAETKEAAAAKIKTHFGLDEKQADQFLATPLEQLVGSSLKGKSGIEADQAEAEEKYLTTTGRKVYGGGGIRPDISVKVERKPTFVQDLERSRVFLDFVSTYVGRDSSLSDMGMVEVDEEIVEEFAHFIQKADDFAQGEDQGQKSIASLRLASKRLELAPHVEALLDSLEQHFSGARVESIVKPDIQPHIKAALIREFTLRLEGKKASILADLKNDQQVQRAIDLLNDEKRYRDLLNIGAS